MERQSLLAMGRNKMSSRKPLPKKATSKMVMKSRRMEQVMTLAKTKDKQKRDAMLTKKKIRSPKRKRLGNWRLARPTKTS